MKKFLVIAMVVFCVLPSFSQSENPFEGTFDGMFEVPNDPMPVPQGVMGPLNPTVP